MKVAHLTTVDMSLRYLLLPQLLASNERGEVIGISAPGEFVPELEQMGIRHVPLESSTRGMDLVADLKSAVELWRILRVERPDILHTHNPKPGVYGRVLGRLAGVPIVINTVHGLYASQESAWSRKALVYLLEWFASRFSDVELIQSPEDFDLIRRLRLFPRSHITLLGNGVDLNRFQPSRAATERNRLRADLGVEESQIVVGLVGRLVAEKGIPEFVKAASKLDDRYVFVIVGPEDPTKPDSLSEETIELARVRGIRLLGHRKDTDLLYGTFDIFALPSHREGFPRAAMEAAATGLPVIATDIRGCRQVVDDEINGILVPLRDPAALAMAIERLGSDPELSRAMGLASRQKAEREFDEREVVRRVLDAYERTARVKGLSWMVEEPGSDLRLRPAAREDARAIAELHRRSITGGFLSSLGAPLLELIYAALIDSRLGKVIVAEANEAVVGFVAGTSNTSAFYREFIRAKWIAAGMRLFPALFRSGVWRRVWDVLRYGSAGEHMDSELLAIAIAPRWRGRGLAAQLVAALQVWAESHRLATMKVVVGEDNASAIGLYRRCGFEQRRYFEMHRGETSLELVWSASP
jgi:glycosyltransferase involved in cell wall biosynthesis/ribosomal protein S18 acetylase RimI-like enzyme